MLDVLRSETIDLNMIVSFTANISYINKSNQDDKYL
jgi:hypothetical protein